MDCAHTFHSLLQNVQATAEKMKPLLGIESFVSMATNGVTWLTSLLYFLAVMNAVWLLTLSKRHDCTRRIMFRLCCLEALLECTMHWMVTQGLLADAERVYSIGILRSWTMMVECILYVVGLVLSVLKSCRRSTQEGAVTSESMMEMMQLIAANAEKLRKEVPLQEEKKQQQQRGVEVVVPRVQQLPVLYRHVNHESANDASASVFSLSPMYKELSLPDVSHAASNVVSTPTITTTREAMEQQYAAAYEEALRVLSQQASQCPNAAGMISSHQVSPQESSPQLSVQVIDEAKTDVLNKDCKKRLLDEDGEDDDEEAEEPERKKARK